jgi:hypothetical protein
VSTAGATAEPQASTTTKWPTTKRRKPAAPATNETIADDRDDDLLPE